MGLTWLWMAMMLTVAVSADRGGSSLRGALEALQRRQRGHVHTPLAPPPDYDALYEFVPPQGYPEPDYGADVDDIEDEPNPRYVVKLLNDERPSEAYEYKLIKKKNTHFEETPNKLESAFRERTHHSNNDKLRDLFMDKNELEQEKKPDVNEKDAEYALLLGQLWSKYKYSKEHPKNYESAPQGVVKLYKDKVVKKRYPDNWGPIAFKRKRSSNPDGPILPDYSDRKSESGTLDSNYGNYELNDDDKDELREEYSIAFQPLDDDSLSDLADDDQYAYQAVEKRFPVSKRSSGPYDFGTKKRTQNQNKREAMKSFRSSSGTDPKIIRDLSKIFGDTEVQFIKNPVKRSSDHVEGSHEVAPPMVTVAQNHTQDRNHSSVPDDDSHERHGHNMHHPGISSKEVEIEHDHGHHHGNDHQHEHEHEHSAKEVENPIILKKKSIDWSDYFGIDKRVKKPISFIEENDETQDKLRKQYFDTFNKEVIYPLDSFRRHSYTKRNLIKPKPSVKPEVQDRAQALTVRNNEKRSTADDNDSKLDNIDKKLKSMEGFIVDEALHFSANVGEELDSKEEQEMKEKLLSRLAAAYSLEKMRKALKDFKHSLQTQRPVMTADSLPLPTDEAKKKRVAVKKELLNNEIPLSNKLEKNDDFEDEQGAGHYINGKVEEQFSEGYMGGSGRHRVPVMATVSEDDGSCPVLTKIIQRCRSVDLLAGDRGQLFLPLCSLHQICYLCGEAPPTTCDLVFLSEADTSCEGDMSCQRAARAALMALRELHDNLADELDGECEASPCLPATLNLNVGWQRALQR